MPATPQLKLADGADCQLLELNNAFSIERGFILGNKSNQTTTCNNVDVTEEITNSYIQENTMISYANCDNIRIEKRLWAQHWNELYVEWIRDSNIHSVGPDW